MEDFSQPPPPLLYKGAFSQSHATPQRPPRGWRACEFQINSTKCGLNSDYWPRIWWTSRSKNYVGVSSSERGATDLSALAESFQWAELMQFKLDTQRGTLWGFESGNKICVSQFSRHQTDSSLHTERGNKGGNKVQIWGQLTGLASLDKERRFLEKEKMRKLSFYLCLPGSKSSDHYRFKLPGLIERERCKVKVKVWKRERKREKGTAF